MAPALAASCFLFLALATGAIALLSRSSSAAGDDRVRGLRPGGASERVPAAVASLRRSQSSIPTLRRFLTDSPWADKVELQLQQANVQLRVGEYLLVRFFMAGIAFFVALLIMRFDPVGILLGFVLGAVGYALPPLLLKVLRARRLARIEKQLVEFAPMLAAALRSGFALPHGVELAAQQLGPPLADELKLLMNDVNLGAPMDSALLDLGRRIGSADLDMMITAILVQRSTGGNLAEILDKAAETLRERERIRGDLNTLTAQPRFTGLLLSVYPMAIALLLGALMPSLWVLLFTEPLGRVFLGIALGLQVVGFVVMRRLVNIEI